MVRFDAVALLASGGAGMPSFRVLREYQRAVVFMLGRFWKVKGPGFFLLIPAI
jgi:regulator of protease activity HflC (stomatin/prohibitin superfamily)